MSRIDLSVHHSSKADLCGLIGRGRRPQFPMAVNQFHRLRARSKVLLESARTFFSSSTNRRVANSMPTFNKTPSFFGCESWAWGVEWEKPCTNSRRNNIHCCKEHKEQTKLKLIVIVTSEIPGLVIMHRNFHSQCHFHRLYLLILVWAHLIVLRSQRATQDLPFHLFLLTIVPIPGLIHCLRRCQKGSCHLYPQMYVSYLLKTDSWSLKSLL